MSVRSVEAELIQHIEHALDPPVMTDSRKGWSEAQGLGLRGQILRN